MSQELIFKQMVDGKCVVKVVCLDPYLPDVLVSLRAFLLACGYSIKPHEDIEVIDNSDN